MKIGKTGLLLAVVGIPLIVLGGMGMSRSQQFEEQSKLRAELAIAKQRLATLQPEKQTTAENSMEKQISETRQKTEAARASLSPDIGSIVTDNRLLALARSCSVSIKQLDSSGRNSDDLYGMKSYACSINITFEGKLDNLVEFVCKLNEEYKSGVVESVSISRHEEAEDNLAEAKVQFSLYTYKDS